MLRHLARGRGMGSALPVSSRNYRLFLWDGTFFFMGLAFMESSTVLPAFVSTLTDSPLAVGAVTALRQGGNLLPQLVVAGFIPFLPRIKPLLLRTNLVGRLAALTLVLITAWLIPVHPPLALVIFLALVGVYSVAEGASHLTWTELVARTIAPARRGRLLGTMQFTGGIAALVAGLVTRMVLAWPELVYPMNYALVFFLGQLAFIFSFTCMCSLGETPVIPREGAARQCWQPWSVGLGRQPGFRDLMVSRILVSGYLIALPFYVIHAQQVLAVPPSFLGVFTASQMSGTTLGGLVWARVAEKRGSRHLLHTVTASLALLPPLALVSSACMTWGLPQLARVLYMLLFVLAGSGMGGVWLAYTTYLLELVEDRARPTYLGLMNTLSAPLALLPLVGGWVLHHSSYATLLLVATFLSIAGLMAVRRLPHPDSTAPARG